MKLHVFHHTDLDGMGVKILGVLYSKLYGIPCETYSCGYSRINTEVRSVLEYMNPTDSIIIGDISVDKDTAKLLNTAYNSGVRIKLYDHHSPAKFLNEYEWATVETERNGQPICGTKLLFEDPMMYLLQNPLSYFVETVNSWDTWTWKKDDNRIACHLNSLFTIMGEEKFTEYIVNLVYHPSTAESRGYWLYDLSSEDRLFTEKTRIMVETHQTLIENQVKSVEKYLYTMNLWVQIARLKTERFKCGVIFINENLSEVGDKILDNHPELDILMMVVFPGNISWRTHKDLPISLSKIAKMATGSGGGHSQAAGSNISFTKFQDMFCRFMDWNFATSMEYSDLTSAYIRNKRAEMRNKND